MKSWLFQKYLIQKHIITTLPCSNHRVYILEIRGMGPSQALVNHCLCSVLQKKVIVYSLDPSVTLLANELSPAELHLLQSLNCCLLLAHWSIASSWEPSLDLVPLGANSWDNLRRLFSKFQSRLNHISMRVRQHFKTEFQIFQSLK